MTLMMKAMAKAQMRLFLTHVCRFFLEGWTEAKRRQREQNNGKGSIFTHHCAMSTTDEGVNEFGTDFSVQKHLCCCIVM